MRTAIICAVVVSLVAAAAAVHVEQRRGSAACCNAVVTTCCVVVRVNNDPINISEASALLNSTAVDVEAQTKPANREGREDEEEQRQKTRRTFEDEDVLRTDFMKDELAASKSIHNQYVKQRAADVKAEDKREAVRHKEHDVLIAHENNMTAHVKKFIAKTGVVANETEKIAVGNAASMKKLLTELKSAERKVQKTVDQSISETKRERQRTLKHREKMNKLLKKHLRHIRRKTRLFHADLVHRMKKQALVDKGALDKIEELHKAKLHRKAKAAASKHTQKLNAKSALDQKRLAFDRSVLNEANQKRKEAARKRSHALKWIVQLRKKKFQSDRSFEKALVLENDEKARRRREWERKVHQEATLKAKKAEAAMLKFKTMRQQAAEAARAAAAKWEARASEERMRKHEEHEAAQRKFKAEWRAENLKKKSLKPQDLSGEVKAAEKRLRTAQDAEQGKKSKEAAAWREKEKQERRKKAAAVKASDKKLASLEATEARTKAVAKAAYTRSQQRAQGEAAKIQAHMAKEINLIDRMSTDVAVKEASSLKELATAADDDLKIASASPLGDMKSVDALMDEDLLKK